MLTVIYGSHRAQRVESELLIVDGSSLFLSSGGVGRRCEERPLARLKNGRWDLDVGIIRGPSSHTKEVAVVATHGRAVVCHGTRLLEAPVLVVRIAGQRLELRVAAGIDPDGRIQGLNGLVASAGFGGLWLTPSRELPLPLELMAASSLLALPYVAPGGPLLRPSALAQLSR